MATPTLVATDAVDGSGVSAPRLQTIDGIGPAGLSRDAVANGSQIVTLGEILAGCHEPGHYDAGMVARISIGG